MNPVLVVTGGSRGLGEAIAELAADRGFDVCLTYRTERQRADAVVARIRDRGRRAIAIQVDVGNDSEVRRAFGEVDRQLGAVTALVNNAGTSGRKGRVEDLDGDEVLGLLATNVCGSLLCSREAIRRMSRRHGGAGGHDGPPP